MAEEKWRVIANEYDEYADQQCWLIADDDQNLFEICTIGRDSTAQDAFSFRNDQGALGGKILAWRRAGKQH